MSEAWYPNLFFRVWSAFASYSRKTMKVVWPNSDAQWRGVDSSMSLAFASAPCLTSSLPISEWPLMAAKCRGVRLLEDLESN